MRTLDWAGMYEALMRNRDDPTAWFSLEQRVRTWAREALATRGTHVIEDAVADTCAEVLVSLERAYGAETFDGFCYGKFLNVRRKYWQDGKRVQPLGDDDMAAPEDDGPDPVELALLRQCLEWLKVAHPKERCAVDLRFFSDRSATAIGEVIGVHAGYARQIVSRGVAHLRKCIGEKTGGQHAAT
ncbi:MAG: sigma-70 family RNA polymerase sigma factor [Chloroflexi bacterium]|nr:sigma-70 family RNA polymerase sigma factor [Chloroflexota bacterium]